MPNLGVGALLRDYPRASLAKGLREPILRDRRLKRGLLIL